MHWCQCGSEISPSDTECRVCGRYVPRGVGGWLLFFILTLVFIRPASHIFTFLITYHDSVERFERLTHSSLRYGFYFVEQLVGFGVVGYGIFAGIQLWRIRPTAIKHAQQFMIALVAYGLADFAMAANWAVLMDPRGTFERFSPWGALKPVVATAAYCAIWYSYLLKSKRVQITYSLQGAPGNVSEGINPIRIR
jgi:hypothetical protein